MTTSESPQSAPDDLSPEQQLVVAIMVSQGRPRDEALRKVRDERFMAYALGAHLGPLLTDMAQRWAALLDEWTRLDQAGLTTFDETVPDEDGEA